MRVQVTQENLNSALLSAGRIAGRNSSLPIIANVLLRCSNNRLLIAATNLELAISENIGAKVEEEGDITIPARLLSEFVQNLPSDTVELYSEGNTLHVRSGNYSSKIYGIGADEFPSIPDIEGPGSVSLLGRDLKEAISQVAGAASTDETRPILTGVLVAIDKQNLTMAATDSYRLAEKVLLIDKPSSEDQKIIAPAKSLLELQRLIRDDEPVEIFIDEGQIKFVAGERELVSRLIDGNYPDYKQLIPETNSTKFTIGSKELLRITKVASLFARDTGGSVSLKTDSGEKQVTLSSVAAQVGDNTSVAEVEEIVGDDQVNFNAKYLIDAMQIFPGDKLEFGFSGKLAPCVIRPVGKKTSKYLHIIMPLRS
ncbi:DNA polymerase III subunit beta [Candidatus Saccharibacteria bacterium]|nr:DNA polymerase III subunit beta [Candidatus Saccharibacteria bacterium]MBP9132216.1 DNA polymerase III subunit beta [Candidatus Saccharibacteria bacterium]